MPQLDGLRAVAVGLVLVGHFFPGAGAFFIPLAWSGVQLFFVLSGFLITQIVLLQKQRVEDGHSSDGAAIRTFYLRRFLRLTPLYYLVIILALMFDVGEGRELYPYLLLYLTNVKMALDAAWVGEYSHLWSLAAEEQFYLVWPWLILFLRKKYLPVVLITAILSAMIFKAVMAFTGQSIFSNLLLFGVTDALGMGALLAVMVSAQRIGSVPNRVSGLFLRTLPVAAFVGLAGALWIFYSSYQNKWIDPSFSIWAAASSGLFFTWLVWRSSTGFSGLFGKFLSSRSAIYIGKISYGIYVIHAFVPGAMTRLNITPSVLPAGAYGWFFLNAAVTIALASASWFLMERPISHFKQKFGY